MKIFISFDHIRVFCRKSVYKKTYSTQVFHHICRLRFSSSHALPRFCPWVCQINISLASLSLRSLPVLQTRGASRPSQPTSSPASPHHSRFFTMFLSQLPFILGTCGPHSLIPAPVSIFCLFLLSETVVGEGEVRRVKQALALGRQSWRWRVREGRQ